MSRYPFPFLKMQVTHSSKHCTHVGRTVNTDISCHTGRPPPEVHLDRPAHTLHRQMQPPRPRNTCHGTLKPVGSLCCSRPSSPSCTHPHTHKTHCSTIQAVGFSANCWQCDSQQHLCVFTVQLHYAIWVPHGNQSRSTAKIRLCLFLPLPCGKHKQLLFA